MKNIYRCAALSFAALSLAGFPLSAPAQTLDTIHSFTGTDGAYPYAGLIADAKGTLYGTTYEGGANLSGTVFKLTPPAPGQTAWTETVLHSFRGGYYTGYPVAGLVADPQGNLYGTTSEGGGYGYGTVFKLKPPANGQTAWTYETLYNFRGFSDGADPRAGLLWRQGELYGTAYEGGTGCGDYGCGTVFKLEATFNSSGGVRFTTLYRFAGGNDAYPQAGLIADGKGALYGTTSGSAYNYGTVFKLTPPAPGQTAWTETVLHNFDGYSGDYPIAGLTFDNKGALYGTTAMGGGDATGSGTVFKLTPPAAGQTAWTKSVLHIFTGPPDGGYPQASLIFDNKGVLYGTTSGGGRTDSGTIFKLTPPVSGIPTWTETVLHDFTGGSDGDSPLGGLIFDNKGVLYGTTELGATDCDGYGCGTVFKLTPGLGKGQTALTETRPPRRMPVEYGSKTKRPRQRLRRSGSN